MSSSHPRRLRHGIPALAAGAAALLAGGATWVVLAQEPGDQRDSSVTDADQVTAPSAPKGGAPLTEVDDDPTTPAPEANELGLSTESELLQQSGELLGGALGGDPDELLTEAERAANDALDGVRDRVEEAIPGATLPEVTLTDASQIEIPDVSQLELPDVSQLELPDVSQLELPDVSQLQLPDGSRLEIPDVSQLQLPDADRLADDASDLLDDLLP